MLGGSGAGREPSAYRPAGDRRAGRASVVWFYVASCARAVSDAPTDECQSEIKKPRRVEVNQCGLGPHSHGAIRDLSENRTSSERGTRTITTGEVMTVRTPQLGAGEVVRTDTSS